jgi:serine protease
MLTKQQIHYLVAVFVIGICFCKPATARPGCQLLRSTTPGDSAQLTEYASERENNVASQELSRGCGGPPPPIVPAPPLGLPPHPAAVTGSNVDSLVIRYRPSTAPTTDNRAYALAANRVQGAQIRALQHTPDTVTLSKQTGPMSVSAAWALAHQMKLDNPDIVTAEPNFRVFPDYRPSDPRYPEQWNLQDPTGGMSMNLAWARLDVEGVRSYVSVAVLDTGGTPHPEHEYPRGDIDPGDYSRFGQCGAGVSGADSSWHGTKVAGVIHAYHNARAGAGMARSFGSTVVGMDTLKVEHFKVSGPCGSTVADITDGINRARTRFREGWLGTRTVINLSYSFAEACPALLQTAINDAYAEGIPIIVSGGNTAVPVSNRFPANCNNVISVGATDKGGQRAWYAGIGATLYAPGGEKQPAAGVGIPSSALGIWTSSNPSTTTRESFGAFDSSIDSFLGRGGFTSVEGSSFAVPHVAGSFALIWMVRPQLTIAQVLAALVQTATPPSTKLSLANAMIYLNIGGRMTIGPPNCLVNPMLCY